jgi:hypothetical protein
MPFYVHVTRCPCLSIVFLVAKFAREKIQPLVREMDEKSFMPASLITDMFDNGVFLFYVFFINHVIAILGYVSKLNLDLLFSNHLSAIYKCLEN